MNFEDIVELHESLDALFEEYEDGVITKAELGEEIYEKYAEPMYYAFAELCELKEKQK